MSTELIINASLPETRIALMESGEIQDLLIERPQGKGITGNIYKGRVTRVLPGMQAAFVDIGLEKAAFLYVDDVFVHSEVFEEEEEASAASQSAQALSEVTGGEAAPAAESQGEEVAEHIEHDEHDEGQEEDHDELADLDDHAEDLEHDHDHDEDEDEDEDHEEDDEDEDDSDDDDQGPVGMSAEGGNGDDVGNRSEPAQSHPGTVAPSEGGGETQQAGVPAGEGALPSEAGQGQGERGGRRRHRRGRRGGRFRNRRDRGEREGKGESQGQAQAGQSEMPAHLQEQVADAGESSSDRAGLSAEAGFGGDSGNTTGGGERRPSVDRQAFRSQRSKDRRVPSGRSRRPMRAQVNIQDLLKEGQEVLVQVAKDPIATKGARLTCHISLPGRHLVCMPTIDHVGVSRRIERDDERRKLRDIVERNRPRNLGFIVRTASGRGQAEARIRQDIDYLSHLWNEIREKSGQVTAPALVYEDLNSTLRAIRDWVTEDIDKIIVDSRYHYNDIQRFVSHFMPSLKQKVELYHGDIPIFDAYNISTELSRALERKVWLKSGGYLVIDQAEALVAIDVNTGRYVGKKNLEDTILKTNLEAVQEIAYQLRLRNCGGMIILDLIDMEKEENKQRVFRALEEALRRDRARPTIIKISELGLIEMTRKRTRDTIVRALCESCSHCEGKGFVKSKVTVAYECLREIEREVIERDVSKILVQAHPDVIDVLAIDERETLDQIERRYRKQIYLQAVTDFHQEQFEVAGDKKPGKQAGEFAEVVQPLKGASAHEREHGRGSERGGNERERGRGRRDRGRRGRGGRDRDQSRTERGDRGDREQRGGRREGREGNEDQRPRQLIEANQQGEGAGGREFIPAHDQGGENYADQQPRQFAEGQEQGGQESHFTQSGDNADANAENQGVSGSGGREGGDDDFFENEEDRLAFLRAQAAQDAALARLNSGQSPAQGRGNQNRGGGGGHGGQGGGQGQGRGGDRDRGARGRRGRRGGRDRFRGNRDQRGFGGNRGGNGPQGGGSGPAGGAGGSEGGGGGTPGGSAPQGGGEGGGGGGGDHSSPPTV